MKKKTIFLGGIFLLIDVISKIIIDNYFKLMESKIIIKNFFSLTKVYNYGASWSMLSGKRVLLIVLAIIILVLLYFYQKKFKENSRNLLAFSLVYAGIIGNLLDRIMRGYVIDFLDFNLFGYNYPIFNLADTFIVLGIVLLIIAIIKKEDENEFSSRWERY